jgi:serine/threonine protein kinase
MSALRHSSLFDARDQHMQLGPYNLIGEIGRGGMGVVLKAREPRRDRHVAIKLINSRDIRNEQARLSLIREASATASLNHSNIVSIYDVNQYKGHLYIVMEYLDGAPLDKLIKTGWPISLKHRLQIIAELCDALAFAHDRGIVHRDIKPSNIFVLRTGTVKVVDFGLAALAQINTTRLQGWAGTIPYMSPEQVNNSQIDARSDVWAAGVTLYELACGKVPFRGETASAVFKQILNDPIPSLPPSLPLSNELNRLLQFALHKSKEQRCGTATILAENVRLLIPLAPSHRWAPIAPGMSSTERIDERTIVSFNLAPVKTEIEKMEIRPSDHMSPGLEGLYRPPDLGFRWEARGKVAIAANKFPLTGFRNSLETNEFEGPFFIIFCLLAGCCAASAAGEAATSQGYFSWILVASATALWLSPRTLKLLATIFSGILSYPRCSICGRPMTQRSRWTRFVKSNTEVVLGYRDCAAALQTGFWEDAAKLLSIHGAEYTSTYASRTIDTALRYHLTFYECTSCGEHLGRLTTDDLITEKWSTRSQFLEAVQACDIQHHSVSRRPRPHAAVFSILRQAFGSIEVDRDMFVKTFFVLFLVLFILYFLSGHTLRLPVPW